MARTTSRPVIAARFASEESRGYFFRGNFLKGEVAVSQKNILVVGSSGISEMEAFRAVFAELGRLGHTAVIFRQDECLNGEALSFEFISGQPRHVVAIDGKSYALDGFDTVWYLHPVLPEKLRRFEPVEQRHFIDVQFKSMRQALWSLYQYTKHWVGNPWSVFQVEDKVYQLSLAIECGFTVPDTVITSDPALFKEFYERHAGRVIVKPLAKTAINDRILFTNQVTSEYLAHANSIRLSPCIFQELVGKAYELRITVVGEKFFVVKISSQTQIQTSLDWRRAMVTPGTNMPVEVTSLPTEIEALLLAFMEKAGLRLGCFDMIVTPDGRYIFLEVNPNGQWLFIEKHTGMRISEAIAELLASE